MSSRTSPYSSLPRERYWRSAVASPQYALTDGLYSKKFSIGLGDSIGTAGSCFAQHIGRHLRANGFAVMDVEPPPPNLPPQHHGTFGYSTYSARYGNIYTMRQLLQLVQEAHGDFQPSEVAWLNPAGKYLDALRPSVEPVGFDTQDEVRCHRDAHLKQVRELVSEMAVLVFTLGLTEAWIDRETGTVYPTAPGTVAGSFDPNRYEFKNFTLQEIVDDFQTLRSALKLYRRGRPLRFILTVSPVPLTATATESHIVLATVHSKSVLRAAAGQLAATNPQIDYFPSYEIITNPWSGHNYFLPNRRSVTAEGVEQVMSVFFDQHRPASPVKQVALKASPKPAPTQSVGTQADRVHCDEELLDAFGPQTP